MVRRLTFSFRKEIKLFLTFIAHVFRSEIILFLNVVEGKSHLIAFKSGVFLPCKAILFLPWKPNFGPMKGSFTTPIEKTRLVILCLFRKYKYNKKKEEEI